MEKVVLGATDYLWVNMEYGFQVPEGYQAHRAQLVSLALGEMQDCLVCIASQA